MSGVAMLGLVLLERIEIGRVRAKVTFSEGFRSVTLWRAYHSRVSLTRLTLLRYGPLTIYGWGAGGLRKWVTGP